VADEIDVKAGERSRRKNGVAATDNMGRALMPGVTIKGMVVGTAVVEVTDHKGLKDHERIIAVEVGWASQV